MIELSRLLTIFYFIAIAAGFSACDRASVRRVILFNGDGVSANDVAATIAVLDNEHLSFTTVNSSELNAMNQAQLRAYNLLIVPGGDFMVMGNSLKKQTAENIRQAVGHGLNYFGICAGGFLAGNSSYYNGFNLTSGVTFTFYSAENKGVHKLAVAVSRPDGSSLDQYWENGPQYLNWGEVVAKYPDGSPAVVQAKYGKGSVILTGIHAEAPADWRRGMVFHTPATIDNAYAATLIQAALNRSTLLHY